MSIGAAPVDLLGARLARYASTRVIVPLAALVGLALLLSALAVYQAGRRQEELQRAAETRAVAQGVRAVADALVDEARDYGWWDDALRHLVLAPDATWADANVGRFIYESFGYEVSGVFRDGRVSYGQIDGERSAEEVAARLGTEAGALVREAIRQSSPSEPHAAFAVLAGTDGLYAAAASPILPSPGSALTAPPGHPAVLLFAKRLDGAFLRQLGDAFGIDGLAYVTAPSDPALPAVPLPGLDGRVTARIQWQPAESGYGQVLPMLPALLGTFLFCGFVALLIEARDRVHRAISESEARFRDISETASDWIWETDEGLRLTFVSEACRRSLGLAPAQLLGRPIHELLEPVADGEDGTTTIATLAAGGPFHGAVFRCRAAGGESRVLRVAGKAAREDGTLHGYRGIATDITAEIGALEQARFLAQHDALTGLPNRVLLRERLGELTARCRRRGAAAAVLCLDLDGFKEVNDTLGHACGDLLLVRCAERLRGCLRGSDTVGRQGGDEFTILQADIDRPDDVETLCRRVVEVIAEPFDLDGHKAQVTVSIGVAVLPSDGHDPAELLLRADMALYRAKSGGRNRYCFFEEGMDRHLRQRRQAEAELRAALANGELRVCYQPQVDCATGALVGVEALLRWQHPQRSMLLPGEFIPLAEETGLIHGLGAWVLETACRDAAAWGTLRVSVNVSPVQFRQRDLAQTVAGSLASSGLDPARLELEVTEGLLVHDTGPALATLAELKQLGVRITMDDFGTGYSSLAYLQRFPFDKIKIDRSFIQQLGGRPNTRAIVRAIVQLGRSLSVPICAEGVETAGQLAQLRDEGCQEAQGYLFARPVPAAEVARLAARWPGQPAGPTRTRRELRLAAAGKGAA